MNASSQKNTAQNNAATQSQPSIKPKIRALLSILISLHLFAVFLGPFSVAPSSSLANELRSWFQPYIQLVDLDHGYKFFAPSPGPSHLVRYEVKDDDGKTIKEATFPNLDDQWPRLLYHRHFMMSEWLYSNGSNFIQPPKLKYPTPEDAKSDSPAMQRWQMDYDQWAAVQIEPPKPTGVADDSEEMQQWQENHEYWQQTQEYKKVYELYLNSYANHLKKRYGSENVKLFLVTHELTNQQYILDGAKLDRKDSFLESPIYPIPKPTLRPDVIPPPEIEPITPGRGPLRPREQPPQPEIEEI